MYAIVTESNGLSLNFPTQEDYEKYSARYLKLQVETYIELRAKYGVWASNQDKYVSSVTELNDFDSWREEIAAKIYLESKNDA